MKSRTETVRMNQGKVSVQREGPVTEVPAQADRRRALSVMFERLDERLAGSDQPPPLEDWVSGAQARTMVRGTTLTPGTVIWGWVAARQGVVKLAGIERMDRHKGSRVTPLWRAAAEGQLQSWIQGAQTEGLAITQREQFLLRVLDSLQKRWSSAGIP